MVNEAAVPVVDSLAVKKMLYGDSAVTANPKDPSAEVNALCTEAVTSIGAGAFGMVNTVVPTKVE